MSTITLSRDEAIRRLQTVESEIRSLGVRRLPLFGSVLRNQARPDSDVDVLVEFTPAEKTFDRFMALADLLEDTLEHPVEVVTTESLSPFIGPHILAEARDVLQPRDYLRHILVEVEYLLDQSQGLSSERFEADDTLRRAFVRSLEVIGEAVKNLPEEFRAAHSEVEWRPIARMRDRLIHGYFGWTISSYGTWFRRSFQN